VPRTPWPHEVVRGLGYRRLRGAPVQVWIRRGPAEPCEALAPGDAPGALVTGLTARRRAILYDPLGVLEVGREYMVWEPLGGPSARLQVEGPRGPRVFEARVLEGAPRLWHLVGPPDWWWEALGLLQRRLEELRPWRVVLAPSSVPPRIRPAPWLPAPPEPAPGRAPVLGVCGG